jgi:hypothetical protein
LKYPLNILNKVNPRALHLFKFIGLLPAGVNKDELTEMWEGNEWKKHKTTLIRASLLVYKVKEDIYTLLPFMNVRAYELLEETKQLKIQYHLKC